MAWLPISPSLPAGPSPSLAQPNNHAPSSSSFSSVQEHTRHMSTAPPAPPSAPFPPPFMPPPRLLLALASPLPSPPPPSPSLSFLSFSHLFLPPHRGPPWLYLEAHRADAVVTKNDVRCWEWNQGFFRVKISEDTRRWSRRERLRRARLPPRQARRPLLPLPRLRPPPASRACHRPPLGEPSILWENLSPFPRFLWVRAVERHHGLRCSSSPSPPSLKPEAFLSEIQLTLIFYFINVQFLIQSQLTSWPSGCIPASPPGDPSSIPNRSNSPPFSSVFVFRPQLGLSPAPPPLGLAPSGQ